MRMDEEILTFDDWRKLAEKNLSKNSPAETITSFLRKLLEIGADPIAEEKALEIIKKKTRISTGSLKKAYDKVKKEIIEGEEKFTTKVLSGEEFTILHPGGGIFEDLVYEPIGKYAYVWKKGLARGISVAYVVEDEETKLKRWFIKIGDETYSFGERRPHYKLPFYVPDFEKVKQWVNGEIQSKSCLEIYQEIRKTLEICLDLTQPIDYDTLTIIVLTSWLAEKLEAVPYCNIIGGFGAGKTVALEALKMLFHHGVLAGDISTAFMGRAIDEFKLSTLYDEYDVKKKRGEEEEGDTDKIARTSYRKENFFIRIRPKTFEIDISDPFGVKVFSIHSATERALGTRGIPIYIGESQDKRISVVNIFKRDLGHKVMEDVFFWYMDSATNINFNEIDWSSIDLRKSVDEVREDVYNVAIAGFNEKERAFLEALRGRNMELAYIMLVILRGMGISEALLPGLIETFKAKVEDELEFVESSQLGVLRDILLKFYNEWEEEIKTHPEKKKEDVFWIENKTVYDEFNDKMLEMGWKKVGHKRFRSMLRDLGFVDKVSYKPKKVETGEKDKEGNEKTKTVNCLFFDKRVLEKLVGLTSLTSLESLNIPEQEQKEKKILKDSDLLQNVQTPTTPQTPQTEQDKQIELPRLTGLAYMTEDRIFDLLPVGVEFPFRQWEDLWMGMNQEDPNTAYHAFWQVVKESKKTGRIFSPREGVVVRRY
jgi:hypothetical protein